jgi:hypothetical protein
MISVAKNGLGHLSPEDVPLFLQQKVFEVKPHVALVLELAVKLV